MTTLTIQVPDELEKEHQETVQFIASKLYEAGKLSFGQAAEMSGVSKHDFPAILNRYGVEYIQYDYEEILSDIKRIND